MNRKRKLEINKPFYVLNGRTNSITIPTWSRRILRFLISRLKSVLPCRFPSASPSKANAKGNAEILLNEKVKLKFWSANSRLMDTHTHTQQTSRIFAFSIPFLNFTQNLFRSQHTIKQRIYRYHKKFQSFLSVIQIFMVCRMVLVLRLLVARKTSKSYTRRQENRSTADVEHVKLYRKWKKAHPAASKVNETNQIHILMNFKCKMVLV